MILICFICSCCIYRHKW